MGNATRDEIRTDFLPVDDAYTEMASAMGCDPVEMAALIRADKPGMTPIFAPAKISATPEPLKEYIKPERKAESKDPNWPFGWMSGLGYQMYAM